MNKHHPLIGQPVDRRDGERELTITSPIELRQVEIALPIPDEIILLHAHEAGVDVQWTNNRRGVGGHIGTAPTWRWALHLAHTWLVAEGLA